MFFRPSRTGLVVAAAFLAGSLAAGAVPECPAWSGEPDPLPSVGDADPVAARWAAFRAAELSALAEALEASSRALAHPLWRHVACLDPGRRGLAASLERTRPVRAAQPALVAAFEPPPGPPAPDARTAALVLGLPIAIRSLRAAAPGVAKQGPPADGRAAAALAEAQAALRAARYREALERVALALGQLPRGADGSALRTTRAQLEVVAGTAALALGREADARRSFERALDEDPALRLDAANHAPKVLRLFESVRRPSPETPS